MIGVISRETEERLVGEFFELFKTPWEFYNPDRNYDVVISTQNRIPKTNFKLAVIYSSDPGCSDLGTKIAVRSKYEGGSVKYRNLEIPIYGDLLVFEGEGEPFLTLKDDSRIVGLRVETSKPEVILLGYNLFAEIDFLLSAGQPKESSLVPTLEIHVLILRSLIIDAGIPLIEIPPVPPGYDFISCLSHDIDFWGIRNHKFDHTMWGFLYRASIGSLFRFFSGKLSLRKLIKNWNAVVSLPFVYLGFREDFWNQVDAYGNIEKEMKSTFFLIPFKNRAGEEAPGVVRKRRAAKYDISDVSETARALREEGFEIGTHGIDAWHNPEKARSELGRVVGYCGTSGTGVRIHWLYFDRDSYRILDDAGFSYDSSCGYNETVGYRAGTLQVFKPFKANHLLELPLHIQDTALFYARRMNLSEKEAMDLCGRLIEDARAYGGVVTVLWHDRSLAPERLWGDFYIELLRKIKENKVWFATAGEIVHWFRRRRAITFQKVEIDDNQIRLSLKYGNDENNEIKQPFAFLRVYHPKLSKPNEESTLHSGYGYKDIPLKGETSFEIKLNSPNA